MGTTEDILETRDEINHALRQMRLKNGEFYRKYYDDKEPNCDDDKLAKRFENTFNRQLSRPGTGTGALNQLKKYLEFIYSMKEYAKAGMIPPRNIIYPELNIDIQDRLASISRSLDRKLQKKSDK